MHANEMTNESVAGNRSTVESVEEKELVPDKENGKEPIKGKVAQPYIAEKVSTVCLDWANILEML